MSSSVPPARRVAAALVPAAQIHAAASRIEPVATAAPAPAALPRGPMADYGDAARELIPRLNKIADKLRPIAIAHDVRLALDLIDQAGGLIDRADGILLASMFDPKARAAKAGLYPGAYVKITAKALQVYTGLFVAEDRWTVTSLHGDYVYCDGSDGRIFFAVQQIEIAPEPEKAAE